MTKRLLTLFFPLLLAVPAMFLVAQDDDPTPRPTKTPTVVPGDANVTTVSAQMDPFIQSDLSILSGNVQRPNGLVYHNGNVYASCNGDWTIYEIEAETGSTISYLWGIRNAHTLHAEDDADGNLNLWVPDFQTNELVRVYQRTTETIVEGLEGPWGIDTHGDDFVVTNLLGNNVAQITREGEVTPIIEGLRSPTGVVVTDDAIYVANNGSARRAIEWVNLDNIDPDTPVQSDEDGAIASLVTGLQNTTGMLLGPDDMLYFAYSLGTRGVVGRIDPMMCRENGGCTNDQVEIVVYTDLAAPLAGLALSDDMRLYTHTIFSPDIYYVDLLPASTG